jgi:hypothetical protein
MGNAAPSPELLILLAAIEARRDHKGADWCRRHGIGAQRAILANCNVLPLSAGRSPEMLAYLESRRRAADVLAATCAVCRGCKLAGD